MAFDSRDYEFADMELILAGKDVIELRGIKHVSKIEREPLYAKGRRPHSIQSGNLSFEGEITVTLAGYKKMVDAAPKRSILMLKGTTAILRYGNPTEGMMMRNDTIFGIYFTEEGVEAKQEDKSIDVTIPFLALDIVNG